MQEEKCKQKRFCTQILNAFVPRDEEQQRDGKFSLFDALSQPSCLDEGFLTQLKSAFVAGNTWKLSFLHFPFVEKQTKSKLREQGTKTKRTKNFPNFLLFPSPAYFVDTSENLTSETLNLIVIYERQAFREREKKTLEG